MIKMDSLRISKKIRVVSNPKKIKECSEKRLEFYTNYASAVSGTLKRPTFQRFLNWIIKREAIEKKAVKDIQVRVFPFEKKNGNFLAGRCNNEGIIQIFPKRRSDLQKKLQKHTKEKVRFYLKSRAIAALIHEVLHLKYEGNESKVRQLTKKYFSTFFHKQDVSAERVESVKSILFSD
jgi:hypothetical protein